MKNYHLQELVDGVSGSMQDDHEVKMSGKDLKELLIGFIQFSDDLLDNQKRMYEFLQGLKKYDTGENR